MADSVGAPIEAAVTGARQRFRAVLMTAFSFILGVLPLVIATGAGANSRRAIGTTVFSGMLAATLVGIFLISALYVAFQSLREKVPKSPESQPESVARDCAVLEAGAGRKRLEGRRWPGVRPGHLGRMSLR